MRIYFTGEDGQVLNRSKYLRGALVKNGHRVLKRKPRDGTEEGVWFHGVSRDEDKSISERLLPLMRSFRGPLVFFRNDDTTRFGLERIPDELVTRASLFLRNHWPSDEGEISPRIRDRTGFLNPLLKPTRSRRGMPLTRRPIPILFYGAATGGQDFCSGRNCRIEALRMLKRASLPVRGGLIPHSSYPVPEDLLVSAVSQREHDALLGRSRICLALWGNCPLTYRFFEGLANRCLVVVPSLSIVRFADCGLAAGRHFVEVAPDLSDLVGKIRYYLSHLKEAQQIADAGFDHFRKHFEFAGVDFPQALSHEIRCTWHGLLGVDRKVALRSRVAKIILPHVRSL